MNNIKKLLIANRGEIACRIIRSAQDMGIECAAIYSDADSQALHVSLADIAFPVGPPESRDSYLNMDAIIDAALQWEADAIHPGYGFLSENGDFAQAVTDAGLIFVGPSADAIRDMGSKSRAKTLMQEAGVPLLPGYHADSQDADTLAEAAEAMGYPLLIKAVSGGGGRGLRVVEKAEDFPAALQAVRREARAAFDDDRVLLEKYLPRARHVEVQVFADQQGHCIHLFERDCSIQRRHQKIIEEAPAPGLDETLRQQMGDAAVRAAAAINYCGAGTVEFLLQDEHFYFMEMNTRLQVEHPVTEAITGLDLVEWQLRVASGEALPLTQSQVSRTGWAIEARINAEDPEQDFMPSTGCISSLHWAAVPGLRIDTGVRSNSRISVYYDSMIAKLIVHAEDRDQAIAALISALKHSELRGITHNMDFLRAVLEQKAFKEAALDTAFLLKHQDTIQRSLSVISRENALQADLRGQSSGRHETPLDSWRSIGHNRFSRRYHLRGEPSPALADARSASDQLAGSALFAPLPGKVLAVAVKEAQHVKKGEVLVILDAMKMEHSITASSDCVISAVHCEADQLVQPDQLLLEFATEETAEDA